MTHGDLLKADTPTVVHVATVDVSLEKLLGPQLEAIAAAGYRVIGVSATGPYVDALSRRGIEHVPLTHATRAMAPMEDVRVVAELLALLRRIRPSIVHTHTPKPSIYGRVAARLAGVPVIVNTVHGLYAQPEDPWPKRLAVYLLNAGLGIDLDRFDRDTVTAGDRAAARRELGADADDDVVVGVVARLVREKGYPELFDATARLRRRYPQLRVAAIGPDEPDKADALTEADRRTAREIGIRFLGARDDVARLYAGMDLLVLASRREGFPLTPMEAAAMGVPVVATDIRGCRQVVDDGTTGLLVPVGDPAALAAAIERLVMDPAERLRLGAAARRKAHDSFDQGRCIDITLATYERLLIRAGLAAPGKTAAA
jgi:glycosyltransferase involved in cell wall biosynthesis